MEYDRIHTKNTKSIRTVMASFPMWQSASSNWNRKLPAVDSLNEYILPAFTGKEPYIFLILPAPLRAAAQQAHQKTFSVWTAAICTTQTDL